MVKKNIIIIKKFLNRLKKCFFTIALVFIFANLKGFNGFAATKWANLKTITPGVLTYATNATLSPFEYLDKSNKPVGFDIDLIEEIARRLGFTPSVKDMPFDSIIGAVNSGMVDVAIAAMTKTDERAKVVDFSIPYYVSNQGVLSRKDQQFKNEDNFNNKTIATQNGTISQSTIEDLINKKHKSINLKTYADYITMVDDLLASRIDAIVLDRDTGKAHHNAHSNELTYVDGNSFGWPDEENCIVCSKQNPALLAAINEQIEAIKKEPFYADLIKKYMGDGASAPALNEPTNAPSTNESTETQNSNANSIVEQFKTCFLKNDRWRLYLKGLNITLTITIFAAILGLAIGIGLAFLHVLDFKKLNFLKMFFKLYVDIIRGTPLLLQLFILWFAILKHSKHPVLVAIIACGLNSGAYVCEIVRGAINSIDKGQTEAGLSVGFSPMQTLFNIVLPQGLKNSIPALCNEAVSLLKETAIVGYIAITDLTRAADQIRAATYLSLMPLAIAALIYFALTKLASAGLNLLERKLKRNS